MALKAKDTQNKKSHCNEFVRYVLCGGKDMTFDLSICRDYVLDLLEADHKFLLFGHHQNMLDIVEEAAKKVSSLYYRHNYIYTTHIQEEHW